MFREKKVVACISAKDLGVGAGKGMIKGKLDCRRGCVTVFVGKGT